MKNRGSLLRCESDDRKKNNVSARITSGEGCVSAAAAVANPPILTSQSRYVDSPPEFCSARRLIATNNIWRVGGWACPFGLRLCINPTWWVPYPCRHLLATGWAEIHSEQ